jgi:beta-galactosidase
MKRYLLLLVPIVLSAAPLRVVTLFDRDWRFLKSDAPGAEQPRFDDAAWRKVDVPHDWSIEGPFDERNPTRGSGGFLPAGIGWYRKTFTLPAADARRRVYVEFDGVMANSDVWINGFHLGKRPYGYVTFRYDMTGHVQFGAKPNVIAVRADNSGQPASRWYAGAGIYRHVRLIVTSPVHLEKWATFVTTPARDTVRITTTVVNQSTAAHKVTLETTIIGPDGAPVASGAGKAQQIAAGKTAAITQELHIASPQLWDLDTPRLYRAAVKIPDFDEETVPFGIREFRFDPDTGFWLNGRNVKIKGVCLHHDGGAVGAAVPLALWERRLETLKQIGVNAIRTAHNPPAPEFLDLCDRMGFLVMDEMFDAWTVAKNPYDYHLYFNEWSKIDTRDTVMRDRNHPSIILYSAGNEIRDTPRAEMAKEILKGLVDTFHEADPTRPVTQALFRPNVSHDYDNGLADLLDVVGQNYRENEILAAHRQKPTRKIIGTENQHGREVWLALRDNPPYSGQFLWSGIDYLGESRAWPVVGASSGVLDRTGAMKPMAYERQSWWSDKPMVYITRRVAPRQAGPTDPGYEPNAPRMVQTLFSDWTPANTASHDENVEVYSNCEEVELLLNGKSLGVKPRPADDSARSWRVPFEPGTIEAVGRNKGQAVAKHALRTAGKASKILLTADRTMLGSGFDDVAFLTATAVDDNGVPVPDAKPEITFETSGPGAIAAVDNGDNASREPFQGSRRSAYQGRAIAILKATAEQGRIDVTATAPGLAPGKAVISAATLRFDLSKIQADTVYTPERGYGYEPGSTSGKPPYYFSVRVPEEENYRVTLAVGDAKAAAVTTVKAELRRLVLERVRTAPGQFETRSFIVNVRTPKIAGGGEVRLKPREKTSEAWAWDDKLTLEFTDEHPAVGAIEITKADDIPTIFIAGDSTSTDQPVEPYNSWGQMLTRFFTPAVAIANHGESGESLRGFMGERRLDKVMSVIRPGDYLFVQMGHNDQKERGEGVGAFTTYKADLKRFVALAREHGATPVLITPVARQAVDSLGDYPEAVRQAAKEEGVTLIDLNAMSKVLYQALGPDLRKAFAGNDTTHHSDYGSYELAKCIVEGVRESGLPIVKYMVETPRFDPAHPDAFEKFDVPAEPLRGQRPYGN